MTFPAPSGWERLDGRRDMWGVFETEGDSLEPMAMFRDEQEAHDWIARTCDDEDNGMSHDFYTVAVVRDLEAAVWNSIDDVPKGRPTFDDEEPGDGR